MSIFLDRFIDDPDVVQRVRSTFAGLYSLDRVRWKWLQEEMGGGGGDKEGERKEEEGKGEDREEGGKGG